jgi:hypothetical protein
MDKVVVFGIIYRNHSTLGGFISSIASSTEHAKNRNGQPIEVIIYLLDNSVLTEKQSQEYKSKFENTKDNTISVIYISMRNNLGYLGPLTFAQRLLRTKSYLPDVIIYSNTDIYFEVSFFHNLSLSCTQNAIKTALVAPSIIIKPSGFDQNPKYLRKPRLTHLHFLRQIYSSYILAYLYETASLTRILISLFLKVFRKTFPCKDTSLLPSSYSIYAAHGACLIFLDIFFFMSVPKYPIFLFGEELYLAELAARNKLKTMYDPTLVVYDIRHSSISSLSNLERIKLMHKSLTYLCGCL